MAANSFTIDTSELVFVKRQFKDMQERAKMPKTAMDVIAAKAWKGVINENFPAMEDRDGNKWPALKRRRSGKRHKKETRTQMLRDTGHLWRSIKFTSKQAEAKVYTITKYAGVHQFGAPKKNIPQRDYMYLNSKTNWNIQKTISKYIVDTRIDVSGNN